jgi:hypothetical protein
MWNLWFASSSGANGAADAPPYRTLWADKSGPVALAVKASATEITTAMTLRLQLEATVATGYRVLFPQLTRDAGGFRVLASRALNPEAGPSETVYRQEYELEPFLAGNYSIPPLDVVCLHFAAQPIRLRTPPFPIGVGSVLPYRNPIPAARGIVRRPEARRPYWLAFGLLLAAPAVIAFRRRKAVAGRTRHAEPPGAAALRCLDELTRSPSPDVFYWRLAEIVRSYVQARYAIPVDCVTSAELLEAVRWSGRAGSAALEHLSDLFGLCDRGRFFTARPTPIEMEAAAAHCRAFLTLSEPLPGDADRAGTLLLR